MPLVRSHQTVCWRAQRAGWHELRRERLEAATIITVDMHRI
jgi:hypothetical protein